MDLPSTCSRERSVRSRKASLASSTRRSELPHTSEATGDARKARLKKSCGKLPKPLMEPPAAFSKRPRIRADVEARRVDGGESHSFRSSSISVICQKTEGSPRARQGEKLIASRVG